MDGGGKGTQVEDRACAKDRGQETAWCICGVCSIWPESKAHRRRERRRGWRIGLGPDSEEFGIDALG